MHRNASMVSLLTIALALGVAALNGCAKVNEGSTRRHNFGQHFGQCCSQQRENSHHHHF